MNKTIEKDLLSLFETQTGHKAHDIQPLPLAGSNRSYYRITGNGQSIIGTHNPDLQENRAFFAFSRHFSEKKVPVPLLLNVVEADGLYLQEDLGTQALFGHMMQERAAGRFPVEMYKKTLKELVKLQTEGVKDWDTSYCYPCARFDKQAMLWDLNYFKYYFLRPAYIPYEEHILEKDFHTLADFLLQADSHYLMHRDFQARNVMLHEGNPYFIDFQGGRLGALQYDLASILYQAKANISPEIRQELIDYYLDELSAIMPVDRDAFMIHLHGFILIRTLQVLGAYGFRGIFEGKPHFLESIPYAIDNLDWLLNHTELPIEIPHLLGCVEKMIEAKDRWKHPDKAGDSPLEVTITSFSYLKDGIPEDTSGHGGGFVFDCRALHNPGRYEPYKKLTGRDQEVITFLKKNSEIDAFLSNVYQLVDNSVETYLKRGFDHLAIHFGCTGGQHRSVYSADSLTKYLRHKYGVKVNLTHIAQERKGWVN